MSKRKKKLKLNDPLRDLWRAVNRLDKDQGSAARRNARKDVMAELRRLKAFVDREYPVKTTKTKTRRKRRLPEQIFQDCIESGEWVAADANIVTACAQAGISVKNLKWTEKRSSGRGRNRNTWDVEMDIVLVPEWAAAIAELPNTTVSDLRRAKKSRIERDAIIMESKIKAGIDPALELREAS